MASRTPRHNGRIELLRHFLGLRMEGIGGQCLQKAGRLHGSAVGPAGSKGRQEGLREGGKPGVRDALHFPVRFAAALQLEAEIEDIGQGKTLFQEGDIGIGSLGELSGADQDALSDGPAVLHHKPAQFAGVFYPVKDKGPVLGCS